MIRFSWVLCALSALALGAAPGCGGDDHFDPLPNSDGGPEVPGPDARGGGDVPDGQIDVDGPVITVLSPTEPAPGDYSTGSIVTSDQVAVVCLVERNPETNAPIDSTSVVIEAVSGDRIVEMAGAPGGNVDEYSALLDVADFDNGALQIRCTASDLADAPKTNSGSIDTFLDLGPKIEIFSPIAGQSYGQQVDISFSVTEVPVAPDDVGAVVDAVTVTVGGIDVLVEDTGGGNYFGTVVFDDPAFVPELSGQVEIQVTASNVRADLPVSSAAETVFVADINGPVIAVTAPDPGEVVGGFITITATISDTAGVATVLARIAHQFEIELEPSSGNNFSGTFDSRVLPDFFVFPLVEVIALDAVGNETGVGRVVTVDNRPPLVALDPPRIREYYCPIPEGESTVSCDPSNADPMECSASIDPVGSDAVNDGQTLGQLIELRARIEDQGNGPLSPTTGVAIPHAGVDHDEVRLYVLDDSDGALLVDLDNDGVCDDINPEIVPTSFPTASNEAAVASMVPISPGGESFYPETLDDIGTFAGLEDSGCAGALDFDATPPDTLCTTTDSTIVKPAVDGDNAIFTLAPITEASCMGNAFDAPASNISDGWACVAVRSQDLLGNTRVSPPLRVCIDFDGDGTDGTEGGGNPLDGLGCAPGFGEIADEGNRPLCTDGCLPAQSFVDIPDYNMFEVDP